MPCQQLARRLFIPKLPFLAGAISPDGKPLGMKSGISIQLLWRRSGKATMMTIQVELNPDMEARLVAGAQEPGISLEKYTEA